MVNYYYREGMAHRGDRGDHSMYPTVQILPKGTAMAIERDEIFTAETSAVNAEGRTERYRLHWRAEIVTGTHLGHENVGEVPIVWADESAPPARAVRSARNASVYVRADPVQVTGELQTVVQASQVDSIDELEPGTFYVEVLGES